MAWNKRVLLFAGVALVARLLEVAFVATVERPVRATTLARQAVNGPGDDRLLSQRGRSNIPLNAVAIHADSTFKLDVSRFTSEEAKERHLGACGDPPEVETLATGEENGVYAARGTIRVRYSGKRIFQSFCDPEENRRIFDAATSSVNFRRLVQEDQEAKTRTFEVSKTGRWTLIGIPVNFESTVVAKEDWKKYEISFKLKKQGAMKHMSGFWRVVPLSQDEAIVHFYNEVVPIVRLPSILRGLGGRLIREMAASLLEDVRTAIVRWQTEEASGLVRILHSWEPGDHLEAHRQSMEKAAQLTET